MVITTLKIILIHYLSTVVYKMFISKYHNTDYLIIGTLIEHISELRTHSVIFLFHTFYLIMIDKEKFHQ